MMMVLYNGVARKKSNPEPDHVRRTHNSSNTPTNMRLKHSAIFLSLISSQYVLKVNAKCVSSSRAVSGSVDPVSELNAPIGRYNNSIKILVRFFHSHFLFAKKAKLPATRQKRKKKTLLNINTQKNENAVCVCVMPFNRTNNVNLLSFIYSTFTNTRFQLLTYYF